MADNLPRTISKQFAGLGRLPAQRQFGTVLGLAVVLALAVTVVMWGLRPGYQVLLSGAAERDIAQAVTVLSRQNIPHRLDARSGALMVPATRVAEARLNLATEGLPRADGVGFELLDQDSGIGTSRMVETARYQRALEGEIARSVTTLNSVERARVHLALPRQSVFVRDRIKPGASVIVHLHPGRMLDDAQVAGIVHLVASSVPELEAERVTVIDQRGQLLSQMAGAAAGGLTAQHLDYTRRLEDAYRERIEDILAPLVGPDGMRVQVTADIDFTQIESTRESFDPERIVLRSEQTSEEESRNPVTGGVPGALTNQPPGAATVVMPAQGLMNDEQRTGDPASRSSRSTRNFEVDREVSHIRQAPATLSRISVAVVVDDRIGRGEGGERLRLPRDAAEMAYLQSLVGEAVGFNEARGDRINVVNASFREVAEPEALEARPLWEEPWIRDLARQGMAALGLLLLILLVLRPTLRQLVQLPAPAPGRAMPAMAGGAPGLPEPPGSARAAGQLGQPGDEFQSLSDRGGAGGSLDDELNRVRKVATDDPRLVAQVVRTWMNQDGK
ncbi:MAG: flagellar M-ring protein FliF [Gammaproteobacteria bacterium]|nr:flagellar M-ring protein FliF [Gammaproteobacteria bacterium]